MKTFCLLLAAASTLALSSCNCASCKMKDAASSSSSCSMCKDGTCTMHGAKKTM